MKWVRLLVVPPIETTFPTEESLFTRCLKRVSRRFLINYDVVVRFGDENDRLQTIHVLEPSVHFVWRPM